MNPGGLARRGVLLPGTVAALCTALPAAPVRAWRPFAAALPDPTLLDQARRPWRFRSEALAGRPAVAIEMIYAGCATICPVSTRVMAEARRLLGADDAARLRSVSLTLDPNDTPEGLGAYAAAAGAEAAAAAGDWLFLSGGRVELDAVLRALRARFGRPNDHAPVFFVGDGRVPRLAQLFAIPPPEELAEAVRAALRGEVSKG